MDRGAWWATVHRITKSQTGLKWLSKQAHKAVLRSNMTVYIKVKLTHPMSYLIFFIFSCVFLFLFACFAVLLSMQDLPNQEAQNLNHWITSEVPLPSFIYSAHVHKRLEAPRHWQTAALISWPLASNSLVGNANNYLCEKCDGSINSTYSSLQKKW